MRLCESRIPTYVIARASGKSSLTQTLVQTELNKFVQINWCGEGVPEAKKGLFRALCPIGVWVPF